MSEFRDQINSDITSVFFNFDEYAEKKSIGGRVMDCIPDEYELLERIIDRAKLEHYDGIFKADVLVYVRASDFGLPPKVGQPLEYDGKRTYRVSEVINEMGLYAISLAENRI